MGLNLSHWDARLNKWTCTVPTLALMSVLRKHLLICMKAELGCTFPPLTKGSMVKFLQKMCSLNTVFTVSSIMFCSLTLKSLTGDATGSSPAGSFGICFLTHFLRKGFLHYHLTVLLFLQLFIVLLHKLHLNAPCRLPKTVLCPLRHTWSC